MKNNNISLKKLFQKEDYNSIFNYIKANGFNNVSSELVEIYLKTLEILNKKFLLLDFAEYLRLNYKNFDDKYSLEEINYLLLKSCLDCADIDKFKYYRENIENINYAPYEFRVLYQNFLSDKYIENIENYLIEKKSIDFFIILSRFYILKNNYNLAFENYIHSLKEAFILNDNYYIEIIYSDLLKYYKLFNIDNELYFEILSEINNLNNPIFYYFIALNNFYNFDFESSYKNLEKLMNLDECNNLNLDYFKYKSEYILKIIRYLKHNDHRVFEEITKLIIITFSYIQIKLILESFFEKRHILFLKILKKFLTHNFNLEDLELLNSDESIFYRPKIVLSIENILNIEDKLNSLLEKKNHFNIYFEGLGLYGEIFYIISYFLFKNKSVNVYFNSEQNNFLSKKSKNFFKYINMFNFMKKVSFYENSEFENLDLSFINLDFIDNFDKSKLKKISNNLIYSSAKGLH
ncbi:MAG: hypothetical protein KatS3mg068_1723 [Candidatus Sericytochromatia bacterium]|nr:MAG: hypothetical protein KatS3mg068_1723 [Candidatus Sericytochromatia bacterium]